MSVDPAGRVRILDRRTDLINRGGENVYSIEVEQVLSRHPGVAEVAVVGVPDPMMDSKVGAVVVPRAGETVEPLDLVRIAREEPADFKVPQYMLFRTEALPRNPGGKVDKAALRARPDWGDGVVVTNGLSLLSAQQLALVDRWDGPAGRETFLLRRRATMAFAAGKYVFPGGSVQDSDFEPVPWIGPGPRTWAQRLSCRENLARALVVAAVRELFEETGLLLAGADGMTATVEMGAGETDGLADDRRSVEAHEVTFGAFLRARGLWLRADLLSPWAHWITPRFQPRRFDTRFFVAMLPPGQSAGVLTTESDRGEWVTIERALADVRGGTMEMMRPTRHTLRQLRAIGDLPVEEAAIGRVITAIEPALVEIDGVRYLDGPADEEQ